VPELLLLHALGIGLEVSHQVLDLLDFSFSVGVQNHAQVFHHAEVSTHGISEAGKLAKLWNESHFITSASVLVDQERLVGIRDLFVVASLVVLTIAGGSSLLVESSFRTLRKINPVDFVGLLVVARNHSAAFHSELDCFLRIKSLLLSLGRQVLQIVEGCVRPDHLEADVDVQQNTSFLHDEARVKSWPHLDVVGSQSMSIGLVESLLADCLELKRAHHRVEEDLHEVKVVLVSLLHDLDPLDADSVLLSFVLSFVDREFSYFLETEDT